MSTLQLSQNVLIRSDFKCLYDILVLKSKIKPHLGTVRKTKVIIFLSSHVDTLNTFIKEGQE